MLSRTLPDYLRPPVVEVAISVFFQSPPKLTTARIGEFWVTQQADYPKTEDHPPIIEAVTPEMMAVLPLRRVFMTTSDDRYILQLQQDAFIHNWRKIKQDDEYPHFDAARTRFKAKFGEFREFLSAHELGQLSGTRYEVTYVNHLSGDGGLADVLNDNVELIRLGSATNRKLLPSPRGVNADIWFDLPNDQGTLRTSFKQGARVQDQKEVLQVELTARGKAQPDFSNMDTWLELAHEWIVKGFTEITTPDAHKRWERTL